jgi:hypothetical protein
VISAFEACADFSGDEVCAHCGWLDDEHEADGATPSLVLERAA